MNASSTPIIPTRGIGSVHILVVDDQLPMLQLMRTILEALGFSLIDCVKSGEEALEILSSDSVDIMFLDWMMPTMDGITLTRTIRSELNNSNRFVPIIMLSGRTTSDDIQQARDAGITEFLAKPFTAQQICDRVMSVVERPRHFILAPGFKGPDRRRRHEDSDTERRGPSPIDKKKPS